jgi:hypothetical protein
MLFGSEHYCEVLTAEAAPKYQWAALRALHAALAGSDACWWRKACHEEMASLAAKEVATLSLTLPSNKRLNTLRWVFSYKLHPDGHVEHYQARVIAKKLTQKHGVD